MKIGIIGYGWIGQATKKLFPSAQIYDKFIPEYQLPLYECDLAFLAVPTPWTGGPGLDCSAVEDAIANCGCDFIVIRSATQPGFADEMAKKYHKRIVVQPEYLGETTNHPMLNMDSRDFMILGGDPEDRRLVIDCYATVYNANIKIRQVTRLEAEIIKFSENRAIFYKVMQCQELYDACEAAGVDYYTIRDAVYGDDPRMNLWWTFVYPDRRGADSKCIPKDVYAWCSWAESVGLDPEATKLLLDYNKKLTESNPVAEQKKFELVPLQGDRPVGQHVIYVSCDTNYYYRLVVPLINSIVKQIDWIHVHVHLICYDQPIMDCYEHDRVSFSYEIISKDFISNIKLNTHPDRMYRNTQILKTSDNYVIKEKIYYSCARFMRMQDLFEPEQFVLQIDADTILCRPFGKEDFESVTVVPRGMRKPKDPGTLIASCIGLGTGTAGQDLRQKFAQRLIETFEEGAFWFMDQWILKEIFADIEFESIDINWCSWGDKRNMFFYTGKGDIKGHLEFTSRADMWRD